MVHLNEVNKRVWKWMSTAVRTQNSVDEHITALSYIQSSPAMIQVIQAHPMQNFTGRLEGVGGLRSEQMGLGNQIDGDACMAERSQQQHPTV